MAQLELKEINTAWDTPLWGPNWFGSIGRFFGIDFDSGNPERVAEEVFGPGGVPDDAVMKQWAIQDGRFAFMKLPVRDPSDLPPGTPVLPHLFYVLAHHLHCPHSALCR